ncbi:MAG: hypothetical protein PHF29_05840 [Candidatus Riflebacteria bacterium]|nr:hypothetical protein [Candidatus Riflebacteria bacterium]
MLIVLVNLIILIAVIMLLLYGLKKWNKLITDGDDNEPDSFSMITEKSNVLKPMWILIIGILLITFIFYLYNH